MGKSRRKRIEIVTRPEDHSIKLDLDSPPNPHVTAPLSHPTQPLHIPAKRPDPLRPSVWSGYSPNSADQGLFHDGYNNNHHHSSHATTAGGTSSSGTANGINSSSPESGSGNTTTRHTNGGDRTSLAAESPPAEPSSTPVAGMTTNSMFFS